MLKSDTLRSALITLSVLALILFVWWLGTQPGPAGEQVDPELAALLGPQASGEGSSPVPTPLEVGQAFWAHISNPFYDAGPNDKGIGIQLAHSLLRVTIGFSLAIIVALPLGFIIGASVVMRRGLDPFIQLLKPISPLAWMPLALYIIQDSGQSAIFVIFICSIWPLLLNTAFGVAGVRKEWVYVARSLEVGWFRRAFTVILPAAAPTIMTGMRISIGIAWLVIVAAEMLVGGTGIGYFVWNEWNNLSLESVIVAILLIGAVGMMLDQGLGLASRFIAYSE